LISFFFVSDADADAEAEAEAEAAEAIATYVIEERGRVMKYTRDENEKRLASVVNKRNTYATVMLPLHGYLSIN
jgi:hypothetical protein